MAKREMKSYDLYWSPTGQKIASGVKASTARAAIRKAPRPYSKYKGEIYATDLGRANPGKMKRAPAKSGWIKATAVKFVTRNGKKTVLVRKPATRRKRSR